MHKQTKIALKNAIIGGLSYLQELEKKRSESEPYLVWSKSDDNTWNGKVQQRPKLEKLYYQANGYINEISKEFATQFLNEYPQYNQLVGLELLGQSQFDPLNILRESIRYLKNKYKTFDCNDTAVDELVQEFEAFLNATTVHLRFEAQLINYRMDESSIELPKNLRIRRLSDEEVTSFHGGNLQELVFKARIPGSISISEFVIEGEYEAKKIFGNIPADFTADSNQIKSRLDRVILALRTFKSSPVGYNQIHFKPIKFCPIPISSQFHGDEYIPFGIYHINNSEKENLYKHTALILDMSEPAMETACYRLAAAEIRTRPQDQILDAVIGMEALLLAPLNEKGELRYRFSIHYASLFETPEKKTEALKLAKKLYDLRSTIAHGSNLDLNDKHSLGEKKVTLKEAAEQAIEALRRLISRLLPLCLKGKKAPYKTPEFWERKLGLRN